jgi:hypothetical protein
VGEVAVNAPAKESARKGSTTKEPPLKRPAREGVIEKGVTIE